MNESERERLRCLVYDLADLAQSNSIGSIGWRVSLDKVGEGLTALLNAPTMPTPSTPAFALVGPDGRAILSTMESTRQEAELMAVSWLEDDFSTAHKPMGAPFLPTRPELIAWLAAHGYHIRPVEIRVVPEPEGQEKTP